MGLQILFPILCGLYKQTQLIHLDMSEDQFAPITNNHTGLQKKSLSSSLEQVEFLNGKKLFMLTCPMGKCSGKLSGDYKAN